ncbi:MAG: cation-transporting P-type ATPase, partial [Demequinaceae bacterium]|nr:cation-transporting P-type ATPase [Demequinaceae bacterium]
MSPDTDRLRGGLTQREAHERLSADGPNTMPPPERPSTLRRLGAQLVNPFALLLWAAVGLSWLAHLGTMAVAIAAVVLANGAFAFAQGRRADRAAELLHSLLPVEVAVRRGGAVQQIDAAGLVVGDVVVLEAGDRVPADAEVLAASGLLVDLSTLTG